VAGREHHHTRANVGAQLRCSTHIDQCHGGGLHVSGCQCRNQLCFATGQDDLDQKVEPQFTPRCRSTGHHADQARYVVVCREFVEIRAHARVLLGVEQLDPTLHGAEQFELALGQRNRCLRLKVSLQFTQATLKFAVQAEKQFGTSVSAHWHCAAASYLNIPWIQVANDLIHRLAQWLDAVEQLREEHLPVQHQHW
jgi:hypothetical protein